MELGGRQLAHVGLVREMFEMPSKDVRRHLGLDEGQMRTEGLPEGASGLILVVAVKEWT